MAITKMERLPDEAIGLPVGPLQAIASAVIGSLWPVNDVSIALLIERLYLYHLKENLDRPQDGSLPPAQALRRAQQWLRDKVAAKMAAEFCRQRADAPRAQDAFMRHDLKPPDIRPFAHPVYWAPFTMSGQ
jgi:CHAT domain-containing protein